MHFNLIIFQLLKPTRKDAVSGFSPLIRLFDQFALCLTSHAACVTDEVSNVHMRSCEHANVQVRAIPASF